MNIYIITCYSRNRVIGRDGKMPWHLSADLRRFKKITMQHPIVMGRKTFQSLGRPLPGRCNIILSRNSIAAPPGCEVIHSPRELAGLIGDQDCFVIGGSEIYRLFLNQAARIYRTLLDADVAGDTYFPSLNEDEWEVKKDGEHESDENNDYDMRFETLERIAPSAVN